MSEANMIMFFQYFADVLGDYMKVAQQSLNLALPKFLNRSHICSFCSFGGRQGTHELKEENAQYMMEKPSIKPGVSVVTRTHHLIPELLQSFIGSLLYCLNEPKLFAIYPPAMSVLLSHYEIPIPKIYLFYLLLFRSCK